MGKLLATLQRVELANERLASRSDQLFARQLRQCDLSLRMAGWQRASDRRHGAVIVRAEVAGWGGANPVSAGWTGSFGRIYGVPG